jgi:hypothetical protein
MEGKRHNKDALQADDRNGNLRSDPGVFCLVVILQNPWPNKLRMKLLAKQTTYETEQAS